jgi:hypothetical protein
MLHKAKLLCINCVMAYLVVASCNCGLDFELDDVDIGASNC